jgi:hypothetical protein
VKFDATNAIEDVTVLNKPSATSEASASFTTYQQHHDRYIAGKHSSDTSGSRVPLIKQDKVELKKQARNR